MLNKLKRFFALTLCLALVCCLSVTAVTASSFSVTEPYDNNQTFVTVSASMSAYITSGGIDVDTALGEPHTEASVSCKYLDKALNTKYASDRDSAYYSSVAFVGFNSSDIYHLVEAYYDVWAEVPTSYGWQEFELNDIYVEYDVIA